MPPSAPQRPPIARDAGTPIGPSTPWQPIDAGLVMQDANVTVEDSGTADAGCTGPSCPRLPECATKVCSDGACEVVLADAACARFDGACVRGRCDGELGCVAVVDPACDCDDGDPCTDDRVALDRELAPGESACVHTPMVCPDDGVECTIDVCARGVGCAHIASPGDQCDDGSPCTADRCDSVNGCQHAPLPDGAQCAEPNCGQQSLCRAGKCVAEGALDPACDLWFTPGVNGMLPWHVPACGSNVGDGLLPGAYNAEGSYTIQFTELFMSGERVLFLPQPYPWAARLFDGMQWSAVGALPALPAEHNGSWGVLGFTRSGELMLIGPNNPYQSCSAVLRVDLETGTFTRYADSMFGADPCIATGTRDARPQYVHLAPDGQLWLFNHDGLSVFAGGMWQPVECDGGVGVQYPDIAFDDDGGMWLIGGQASYLVHREPDGACRRVPLPSITPPRVAAHAFTPSGSLLIDTASSVLEISDRGVIEYPQLPADFNGVYQIASDAYGRPLVRGDDDYSGLRLFRHEAAGWKDLGFSEAVVNDDAFRVYNTIQGRVERIEGDRRLPVGPVSAHSRSLAGEQAMPPHLLTLDGARVELDWLRRADRQATGLSSRVFAQRTTLADDVASWQSTGVELLDVPPDAECRYRPPSTLQRTGDRTVLACVDSQLLVRDAQGAKPLAFSPAAPEPYFFSEAQVAIASDRAGSVFVGYIDAATHELHVGHLDAAQQLTLDYTVPGAKMSTWVILHETPMVDLAWAGDGLAVLWQGRENDEDAPWVRGGKLLVNGEWRDLGTPPHGVAAVDHQGRLWLDGANDSRLLPALWTGSEWQAVAGEPIAGAWPGRMIFDADDHPIVVAGDNELRVLRHRDGAWQPVQGSDRPGGVTNSPCNQSYDARLALDGDRLCLSWMETVERPFGLLMRCTQLQD